MPSIHGLTSIVVSGFIASTLSLVGQPSFEQMTKSDKPPAGYIAPAPVAPGQVERLPDTPLVTPGEGLPGLVNPDGTVDKPADIGATPPGYASIEALAGRARVPGNNLEERTTHLRAFFIEKYPQIKNDVPGLDAVIAALIGPANDFRGQLDVTLFNTAATAYQQYSQIAAYLDTLPVRLEVITSLKRFYANRLIVHGDRRYAVEGVKRTFAAITAQTRTVQIPPTDGPAELLGMLWPEFATLSGSAKVRVLTQLSRTNPWLTHDMDKAVSQRDASRKEVAGENEVNSSMSYHDTNLLRPRTNENVSSKLDTRLSIAGQSDIAYEEGGALLRAYFIATPGEWLFLPDDDSLAALAR
ncbi:MAG: hypothetical protein SFY80_12910 [Verrucomicrobiota bacterium]|nr:hypothetical protein [Verrucomicrobiota bacterium]